MSHDRTTHLKQRIASFLQLAARVEDPAVRAHLADMASQLQRELERRQGLTDTASDSGQDAPPIMRD